MDSTRLEPTLRTLTAQSRLNDETLTPNQRPLIVKRHKRLDICAIGQTRDDHRVTVMGSTSGSTHELTTRTHCLLISLLTIAMRVKTLDSRVRLRPVVTLVVTSVATLQLHSIAFALQAFGCQTRHKHSVSVFKKN